MQVRNPCRGAWTEPNSRSNARPRGAGTGGPGRTDRSRARTAPPDPGASPGGGIAWGRRVEGGPGGGEREHQQDEDAADATGQVLEEAPDHATHRRSSCRTAREQVGGEARRRVERREDERPGLDHGQVAVLHREDHQPSEARKREDLLDDDHAADEVAHVEGDHRDGGEHGVRKSVPHQDPRRRSPSAPPCGCSPSAGRRSVRNGPGARYARSGSP